MFSPLSIHDIIYVPFSVYGNLPSESQLADWEFAISQHSAVPQGILVRLFPDSSYLVPLRFLFLLMLAVIVLSQVLIYLLSEMFMPDQKRTSFTMLKNLRVYNFLLA